MKPVAVIVSMTMLAVAAAALSASQQATPAAASQAASGQAASAASGAPAASPTAAGTATAPAQGAAHTAAAAAIPGALAVSPETLRSVAKAVGGGIKPEDIRSTPMPGIFEMRRDSDILYVSQDGKYVFTGDLFKVAGRQNLTEVRRSEIRRELIDAIPESKMVVFSPPDPKYTVTVFTDIDCPYCRTLHSQIAEYNRLGVKVRYVFFPRSGPDTESWYKAEQVWCASDRKAALTQAKLGKLVDGKSCPNTPVAMEYELGKKIGLEGTPGIVASDGTMFGGYLPPDQLVEQLKQLTP
jgi:thiol:disulfide interchange protein DsbC